MKKTLLFSAAALLVASSMSAQRQRPQWETKTVWGFVQTEDALCDFVPGLDGGWSGLNSATAERSFTCSRFAVGINGKIITTDHVKDAFISIDKDGISETPFLSLKGQTTLGSKWNGTAVSTDDAGNFIFNYNFTNATGSIQEWGVLTNGTVTNVTLSTPISELGTFGRVDCLGHVTGDVTSAEGGIGYVSTQNSGVVIMLHFTGDGTKVTKLTATPSTYNIVPLEKMGDSQLTYAVAKYPTVAEILAQGHPENCFYAPIGRRPWQAPEGTINVSEGPVANFNGTDYAPLMGIGNRMVGSIGTIFHDGETYIIRNYLTPEFVEEFPEYGSGHGVMNYGIFDLSGNCVGSWMGSWVGNGFGMSSINVEKVDEYNYNIYTIYSTGSEDKETSTAAGFYCAMTTVTIPQPALKGAGTEADPYIVATADDLCNAWTMIKQGKLVYFKQTADIDMAGVEEYTALNGFNGKYAGAFVYDGDNHIITNFAPKDEAANDENNAYYCTSLFGVLNGTVKNLGVMNANIVTAQGAGILAGYAAHGSAEDLAPKAVIENVFVTGSVTATGSYLGGMVGTNVKPIEFNGTFAQVDVKSISSGTPYIAGFIGRGADVTITNSYVSGTVAAVTSAEEDAEANNGAIMNLIASKNKGVEAATLTMNSVGALNTGTDSYDSYGLQQSGAVLTDVPSIEALEPFNNNVKLNELPAFAWLTEEQIIAGIESVVVDNDANAPAEYYNLQGMRVDNPTNGLYIKRQGKSVTKVVIR